MHLGGKVNFNASYDDKIVSKISKATDAIGSLRGR